jgi:hypothetical protein
MQRNLRHRTSRRIPALVSLLILVGGVTALVAGAGTASAAFPVFTIVSENDANHDGTYSDTEAVAKNAAYPYTVTYKMSLTASAAVNFPTILSLSDDKAATLTSSAGSPSCSSLVGTSVAPGGSVQCYYDVVLAGVGSAPHINTATIVWGRGGDHASDTSTVHFDSLTLQKSSSTTLVTAASQVVPYSYVIANTGTGTVTGISLSDTNVDASPACPSTSLAAGASMACSAQHTATAAELAAGAVDNVATASSNEAADATASLHIPAAAFSTGGMFVVGDLTVGDLGQAAGKGVTFWGAQWWKLNSLSGGTAPAAFKGFEDTPPAPTCGVNWSTDPGNSTPPPASIPPYLLIIVSSNITKSGSVISGDTVHIVIVKTDAGYQGNPGHAGTGTIVGVVC